MESRDNEQREPQDAMAPFLCASRMCDVGAASVQRLARLIEAQSSDTCQRAAIAFLRTQNAVLYRVGIFNDTGSETLQKGYGSCSNEANVLVALLRAMRIPAGFGELQVHGKSARATSSGRPISLGPESSDATLRAACALYMHPSRQHAWWACLRLQGRTGITRSPITYPYRPSTPLLLLARATHTVYLPSPRLYVCRTRDLCRP